MVGLRARAADLTNTIMFAVRRFKESMAFQRRATDLRQALDDSKIIERAKGILMKRRFG
jgi:AmiR/NasT family two-component response regulator